MKNPSSSIDYGRLATARTNPVTHGSAADAGSKVTKANLINTGESKTAIRNESAVAQKSQSGTWWKPAVATAGLAAVGYGVYSLLNFSLPSVPNPLPAYTGAVGGAYQDAAFVPDAPLSDVQNAQRAVYAEQFPGRVNIAANPQVTGVDWGQSEGIYRGEDSGAGVFPVTTGGSWQAGGTGPFTSTGGYSMWGGTGSRADMIQANTEEGTGWGWW